MLVLEFVEGVSLYQVARVTGHRVGSFVCITDSSVIFSDLPCWSVRRRGRERGLSSLLAGCSLTSGDFQKGREEKVLEK